MLSLSKYHTLTLFAAILISITGILCGCGDSVSDSASSRTDSKATSAITKQSDTDTSSDDTDIEKVSSKLSDNSSKAASSKQSDSSSKAVSNKQSDNSSKTASSKAESVNQTPATTEITVQPVTPIIEWYEPIEYTEPEPVEYTVYEQYDEEGRLIIDTDTLDGKKAAAITFDDGPSEYTRGLIEGLNARGAHATFFTVGSNVERYPELLQMMVDGGHQIGNHTYNHPVMTSLGEYYWRNEIAVTDTAIQNACGQTATAFRPPYGAFTYYMAASVDKTFTIWSVDTLDWKTKNFYSVQNEIITNTTDGSIILLHDLYKTSVDAALSAIDILQNEGYVFVTVDELLTRYGYPISNTAHFSQVPVSNTVPAPKPIVPETDTDSDFDTSTDIDIDSEIQTDTEKPIDTADDTDSDSDLGENSEIDTEVFDTEDDSDNTE